MLRTPTSTEEDDDDDEGPLELLDELREQSVAQGEGLPEQDQHHDEDQGCYDHLYGLHVDGITRK